MALFGCVGLGFSDVFVGSGVPVACAVALDGVTPEVVPSGTILGPELQCQNKSPRSNKRMTMIKTVRSLLFTKDKISFGRSLVKEI